MNGSNLKSLELNQDNIQRFISAENTTAFEQAIQIRRTVFVDEQESPPEMEPDSVDSRTDCVQWLILDGITPVATGRLFPEEGTENMGRIGRMAILKSHRGTGLGRVLLTDMIDYGEATLGYTSFILDAQIYAQGYYAKLGFVAEGEQYIPEGDNIWHVKMVRI